MAICFSIDGDPVSQPRVQRTNAGHVYTPDNGVRAYKAALQLAAKAAGAQPTDGPVQMVIDFVFARRPSHLTKSGEVRAGAPALPRPDVDNCGKAVMDALNGVAYLDDRQVSRLVIEKSYGPQGRTTVRIS